MHVKKQQHETLFGAAASWLRSPLEKDHRLKKGSRFEESDEAEDILWALKDVSFEVKRVIITAYRTDTVKEGERIWIA